MKYRSTAIILFFSFMLLILHDLIPHHHEDDDDLLFSHQNHSNHSESTGNSFPFPAHHHFSASEDFDLVRTASGVGSIPQNCFQFTFNYSISSSFQVKYNPSDTLFYPDTPVRINLYFIIMSPNSLRGSPVMA